MREGFLDCSGPELRVGTMDPANPSEFWAPQARVRVEGPWLHIITDDYEGHVILEIEALPFLIEALQLLRGEG